ncbi:ABC transporter ATP-binding protein [Cytobacillus gottheilii]|uniref:ABC transporter ATP-binding protein n=1 Tax=Cytobacillus gottheilii TaxID=859144 RepID=UPI0009BBF15C|nr:ABC transporter ATP-binding protein [Cytobacillus gottheilii]
MILSIEQLGVSTKEKQLVHNVSLSIREGEWFALVGQSGSGKSVLSQAVGQMLPANLKASGNIQFMNQNMLTLDRKQMKDIRGKRISYIFQDYHGSFTPFRTIAQHFHEYQKAHGISSREQRKDNAIEALESVGLDASFYKRYAFQLSGGQLQRVSIALALLLSPDLVIADEITTALDSVSSHKILQLLAQKQKDTGCAILFITHDWRHVRRYADRLAVMKEGQIIETGGKHRILDHPRHEYTRQLIKAAPILGSGLRSGLEEEKKHEPTFS